MKEDVRTILLFAFVAISSAYIRHKGFFQATVDAILAFWFGYGMYLLLDNFALSGASRTGICCILMLFARPLYDWGDLFIRTKLSGIIEKGVGIK